MTDPQQPNTTITALEAEDARRAEEIERLVDDIASGRPRAGGLSFGITALDDFIPLGPGRKAVVVVALPWQPAGETSFVVAQSFAKQGHNPLCVNPGWSPYWDGALDVLRLESAGGPIDYDVVKQRTGGSQPVIIDQFSQLHWDTAKGHAAREQVVADVGRALHWLAWERQSPVVVFTRRRTKDVIRMSVDDLRSDGALEYHVDALLMVDPYPKKATADILVGKHRNGPTGHFPGVDWPDLPRTAYRRGEA